MKLFCINFQGESVTYQKREKNISKIKKGIQKVSTIRSEKICYEISVHKRPQIKHSRFHTRKI